MTQIFSFSKNEKTNFIDVTESRMRPRAYLDAIGVLADLLHEELAANPCACPCCTEARALMPLLPRRTRIANDNPPRLADGTHLIKDEDDGSDTETG